MSRRWYLPSTGAAAVSPAFAAWDDSSEADRLKMVTTRISSAMANKIVTDNFGIVNEKQLWRQYVSDPLAPGAISGTVSGQVRCSESLATANQDEVCLCVKVVSNDGSTLRGTLLALGFYGTTKEYPTGTAENRIIASAQALSSVTAQAGDRLVVEIGTRPSTLPLAAAPTIAAVFGDDNASDLPADQTETSTFNPWIEFSQTIGFALTRSVSDSLALADAAPATTLGHAVADSFALSDAAPARTLGRSVDGGSLVLTDAAEPRRDLLGYYPGEFVDDFAGVPPNPWSGLPQPVPVTPYAIDSGLRACGLPYFAAVQTNLDNSIGIGGGETRMMLVVALHAMPVQLASPDEPHWLASWHEAILGGRELFSLGVTPSGRICAKTVDSPVILSPTAVITADSIPHTISMQMFAGTGFELGFDGVVVVGYGSSAISLQGPFSPLRVPPGTYPPVRFMLFNGLEGRTRCECTIFWCEMVPESQSVRWPVEEGRGLNIHDEELVSGLWANRQPPSALSDYGTVDWRLVVQYYNPLTLGFPLVWGPLPSSDIRDCAHWFLNTQFSPQNPASPTYQPVTL